MIENSNKWSGTLKGIGFALLALLLARLASTPKFEAHFDRNEPVSVCAQETCTTVFVLLVGNTGRENLDSVILELQTETAHKFAMPPNATTYHASPRSYSIEEKEDGLTELELGKLEPGKWSEITFVISVPENETNSRFSWDDLLVGVRTDHGPAKPGEPQMTRLGRSLANMVRFFF